jgi:hypothetical protein
MNMSPKAMRIAGIIFMVAAAVLMVLNLKRVADLGSYWTAIPLFVIGIALVARSRKAML